MRQQLCDSQLFENKAKSFVETCLAQPAIDPVMTAIRKMKIGNSVESFTTKFVFPPMGDYPPAQTRNEIRSIITTTCFNPSLGLGAFTSKDSVITCLRTLLLSSL